MCQFELHNILFANKSINMLTIQFNITIYNSASTWSGANNIFIPPHHLNNTSRHSSFHWLPSLWNSMPVFDLNMSFGGLVYTQIEIEKVFVGTLF